MTNLEKVKLLARDLTKDYPRSPRETLGGYVIAARAVDKCRATLAGTVGEYHAGCSLDRMFLEFAGITFEQLRDFVATGASDTEIGDWVQRTARPRPRIEIIKWNNDLRGKRLSELPEGIQEYMEDYIPKCIPRNRPVYVLFDVYDIEEERM